jgi:hypothetical protein
LPGMEFSTLPVPRSKIAEFMTEWPERAVRIEIH